MHSHPARWGMWAVFLLMGLPGPAVAQDNGETVAPVAVVFHAARPVGELALTRTALARLLTECPLVNGRLDEAAWKGASVLTPLCRAGSARIAAPRTVAMAGYYAGFLYVGVQCDEPNPERRTGIPRARDQCSPEDDCVEVLLDSMLERDGIKAILVNPAGAVADYAVAGQGRDIGWDIECVAAAAPTATGWAVEIGIPRRALDNPINDIIGFNIVRRRRGTAGEPFSWNPAPATCESGEALGCLAFQRRQVTVQKMELGRPYVGANTFRVWLKNETPEGLLVRVGLATHVAGEAADTSRYLIGVPPGRTLIYALSHRIRTPGRTDLAFTVLDHEMGDPLARVTRPGLDVLASPLVLTADEEGDGTGVRFDFRILLPKREMSEASLFAIFRDPATGRLLGSDRTGWVTSRSGIVSVDTAALPAGTYRLDVRLERGGKTFASVGRDVAIVAPKSAE